MRGIGLDMLVTSWTNKSSVGFKLVDPREIAETASAEQTGFFVNVFIS